jgi:hypothetical protein
MAAVWWGQWQLGNPGSGGGGMMSVAVASAWGKHGGGGSSMITRLTMKQS